MSQIEPTVEENDQMAAYSEAVSSGLYAKQSGLVGKYDNVRRYWEDEITRHFLYPHLHEMVCSARVRNQKLRIMDLGCGSGDGYELLTGVRDRDADLTHFQIDLLQDMIESYVGVDLSLDLLKQAADVHGGNPAISFRQGDFSQGLPLEDGEEPYDLYFSSYGTWSHHNDDETAIELLADIARHTQKYSLVLCDWLGRYSYEWRDLWTNKHEDLLNMDYVVSYIYEKEEREAKRDQLQHLNLRLMSRREVERIVQAASERAGCEINMVELFDRSCLIGRHMDTQEYNPFAQSIRNAVNSLHEYNRRTDLNDLKFDFKPVDGFDEQNEFYTRLAHCWNTMVRYTKRLLAHYNDEIQAVTVDPEGGPRGVAKDFPNDLRYLLKRMHRVVDSVGWIDIGLTRENLIEPQLGYTLRNMVVELQQGIGCGHGLCAILEVRK